jgi:hypothetical protein
MIGANGIHAKQFASHLETGNLLFTAIVDIASFEVSEPNCVKAFEWISHPVQTLVTQDPVSAPNDLVETAHVGIIQAHRQTQLVQAATRATGFQYGNIE